MVEAYLRGLLSPRLKSRSEAVRELIILRRIRDEHQHDQAAVQLQRLLAYPGFDRGSDNYPQVWKTTDTLARHMIQLHEPWREIEAEIEQAKEAEAERDRQRWEQDWGSLDDPEVQEKMERLIQALEDDAPDEED